MEEVDRELLRCLGARRCFFGTKEFSSWGAILGCLEVQQRLLNVTELSKGALVLLRQLTCYFGLGINAPNDHTKRNR